MDEFESIDEESPDRYSPDRRSVLKAIGATAVAGGVLPGVVAAQSGCDHSDGCTFTSGDEQCRCAVASNCLYLGKDDSVGALNQKTVEVNPPLNTNTYVIKAGQCCFEVSGTPTNGGVSVTSPGQDVSSVGFYNCPTTGGGTGQSRFFGCSQVCTDAPADAKVASKNKETGEITFSYQALQLSQHGQLKSWNPVYCLEVSSTDTHEIAIVAVRFGSGPDIPNTNQQCAANYQPQPSS